MNTSEIYRKKYNVVEELIISTVNQTIKTVVGLVKNIQGTILMFLASFGLGHKLISLGITRNLACLLSIVGVTLLSV